MKFDHPKTESIIERFEEISRIPRCSKNEKEIGAWLMNWAEKNKFKPRMDGVGNVVIDVPASPGYENVPGVIIQGHMDMVCEKTKTSTHDFEKDPIKFVYDGDWLKADETTLGADNGIAIAMAVEAALDENVKHPHMELLFTVDEETGLTGATALEPGFLKGKYLLNVDSEDEGIFTVGCAGGKDTQMWLSYETEKAPDGYKALKLEAGGMSGGHSGVDIHQQRANAMHVLSRALSELRKETDIRISSISGGTAHNAIPRDAETFVFMAASAVEDAKKKIAALSETVAAEYKKTDPKLSITLSETGDADAAKVMSAESTRKVVDLVMAMPHGVDAYSNDIQGLVETSNNLATISCKEDGVFHVHSSQRSSVMDRMQFLTDRIEAVGRLAGARVETGGGYPAWQPDMDSKLLAICKEVYKKRFDKEPVVEIIHAGLECGIIGSKYPGMDMISFGPTIKNPHSPDECLEIKTIGMVWDFMADLLASLK